MWVKEKKVSFMQFHFFSSWKGNKCCNTTGCKPTRGKKSKNQINYVKWNQSNKKWKLDVFTVLSSHHLWNAKCSSQEREAQLLHVLSGCRRALWAEKSLMKSIFLTNGCLYQVPGTADNDGCGTGAHSKHMNSAPGIWGTSMLPLSVKSPGEESIWHI